MADGPLIGEGRCGFASFLNCVGSDFHRGVREGFSVAFEQCNYSSSEISNSAGALRFSRRLLRSPAKFGRSLENITDAWGPSLTDGTAG